MSTAAERAAKEALLESIKENRIEIALAGETIEVMRSEVRRAIQEGIDVAMRPDNVRRFWTTGLEVLQQQAAQRTGVIMGGVALGVLKRGLIFVLLGGIVYAAGGWEALAAFIKTLTVSAAK